MIIWNIPLGSRLRDSIDREFVLTQADVVPQTMSQHGENVYATVQVRGFSDDNESYSSMYGEQYDWTVLTKSEGSLPVRVVDDSDYDYIIPESTWIY